MTKTLITVAVAFDIDEDKLPDLSNALEESIRDGITARLADESDELIEQFWDEFEYYGAAISLRRERV